ncbi:50S ribosomal protein L16 [Candidatus Micrarchaeota archaeon]|nr:50S ribosomal protein L16 [Candidatus Micrarchaeota archaeon]
MGLRPARTIREAQGQQWARISISKPRKSYVKGAPRPKIRQYEMGSDKYYERRVDLVAVYPFHVRDNALEAARQAANKHLEKTLFIDNYFFRVLKYPHLVIREHSALGVAGADRISKGMKRAIGRPKGRMCRVNTGDSVFAVYCNENAVREVKVALTRAKLKLSGGYDLVVSDITSDPFNLSKKGKAARVAKKREEEKPVAVEAEAGKPEEKAAGEAKETGKPEAKEAAEKKPEKKEADKKEKK